MLKMPLPFLPHSFFPDRLLFSQQDSVFLHYWNQTACRIHTCSSHIVWPQSETFWMNLEGSFSSLSLRPPFSPPSGCWRGRGIGCVQGQVGGGKTWRFPFFSFSFCTLSLDFPLAGFLIRFWFDWNRNRNISQRKYFYENKKTTAIYFVSKSVTKWNVSICFSKTQVASLLFDFIFEIKK